MMGQSGDARILMYSHDSFGLGHLRRTRTIAHALVDEHPHLNVLILSGASIAGAFDYKPRVDFVKIPSVIKLRNGEYRSLDERIDSRTTLAMRRAIIRNTAKALKPDIFIVDKEPLGLRGEVEETLHELKSRGTRLVLGLRDVMDAPHLLEREWKRSDVLGKVTALYDHVWVYGPRDFYDPLTGLDVPDGLREKMEFVNFLQRECDSEGDFGALDVERPYLLATTGGGGDGYDLIEDVLNAYVADPTLDHRLLVVLGPYMPADQRQQFYALAEGLPHVEIIDFHPKMEDLVAGAAAVVSMGGYNTCCEILSFDKPALLVPRIEPRSEQLIRARRAADLGLVDMLHPAEARKPEAMADALHRLLERAPPSANLAGRTLKLDGLKTISRRVGEWLYPAANERARRQSL